MAATPPKWAELMDKVGITSVRQLAKAAGIDHTIVNRVVMRGSGTSLENMEKVAQVLQVPVEDLYQLKSGVTAKPISIPAGSEILSHRQKELVTDIVRSMIEEKKIATGIVDKKSAESTEQAQEKNGNVTPIGVRKTFTPAQAKFEAAGRRVAKIKREIPEDSPKISPTSTDTD